VFLCCLSFFCDDHLLVGVDVVAMSEAPLEDDEASFRLVESLCGSCGKFMWELL